MNDDRQYRVTTRERDTGGWMYQLFVIGADDPLAWESDGKSYRTTWKGAFLMTWNGLWPSSLIRKAAYKQAMRVELQSLEVHGEAAWQKA